MRHHITDQMMPWKPFIVFEDDCTNGFAEGEPVWRNGRVYDTGLRDSGFETHLEHKINDVIMTSRSYHVTSNTSPFWPETSHRVKTVALEDEHSHK